MGGVVTQGRQGPVIVQKKGQPVVFQELVEPAGKIARGERYETGPLEVAGLEDGLRIAPGHNNTWFIRVMGTTFSAVYSTKQPKSLFTMPYSPGGPQAWHVEDVGYTSAYPAITGGIFEFGFPDSMLQMWAAFCDEFVNGRDGMRQPFYCATSQEAARSHDLFTAALDSEKTGQTVSLGMPQHEIGVS